MAVIQLDITIVIDLLYLKINLNYQSLEWQPLYLFINELTTYSLFVFCVLYTIGYLLEPYLLQRSVAVDF